VIQRAVTTAARQAGLTARVTCHTFRHHAERRIMPTNASAVVLMGGGALVDAA
jgi:integrase